jgi:hypothetical protein
MTAEAGEVQAVSVQPFAVPATPTTIRTAGIRNDEYSGNRPLWGQLPGGRPGLQLAGFLIVKATQMRDVSAGATPSYLAI